MIKSVFTFQWLARGAALLAIFSIAACSTGPSTPTQPVVQRPPIETMPTTPVQTAPVPEHMQGREPVRVALLLPTSARNNEIRSIANALLDSAQLAVFEVGNPNLLLMPKDTGGTVAGAEAAAREAINEGAELILGPLLRNSVAAITPLAQESETPIISFSTDSSVAGPGVYLLSFLPEQEIARVTTYAVSQQRYRFAALVPISDYGDRVRDSFVANVGQAGGEVIAVQPYPRRLQDLNEPVQMLANYQHEAVNRTLTAETTYADMVPPQLRPGVGAKSQDPAAARFQVDEADRLQNYTIYNDMPFDAVMLPEGGMLLRALAPTLLYHDIDPKQVKFMGTGLWDDPIIGKEPALVGGWFAAPPPDARDAFVKRFETAYGRKPPRIASLSFDAVALAGALARTPAPQRFANETLTNPNGFSGIDGIFRFTPSGLTERGLAVLEVTPNGFVVIDPPPTSFQAIDQGS